MPDSPIEFVEQTTEKETPPKQVRPVLIVSKETIAQYCLSLEHLITGLTDQSIPLALVCPPGSNIAQIITPVSEIIYHPVIEVPFMGWQNQKMLAESLAKFKPTLLHCLCPSKSLLTRQMSKKLSLPYILSINSMQKRTARLSISAKRCSKILVPAKTIAEYIEKTYPYFADIIQQVNLATFTENDISCFSDKDRVASIVTTAPHKDSEEFSNLLGAIRHLVIDGYEFMLVIIGSDSYEDTLRKNLRSHGLLKIVVNVPSCVPLRPVLAAGDIFVQYQPRDAFNSQLLEAMSVGTAVAGCKGGVDDLIIDDETATVFDPKDELSIYDTLKGLFDRHEIAQGLARNAQQYLRENHSVSMMAADILEVYRQVQG